MSSNAGNKHGTYISVADDQQGTNPRIVTERQPIPVDDYWINYALHEIEDTYGDICSVYTKAKPLLKFGHSSQVQTTPSTIMTLPSGVFNETFVSDNLITTVSSNNAADTRVITIEGHTIDGNGDLTFVIQSATLNGQNQVTLTTPLARCTRIYNNDSTDLIGIIYVYEDDTSTAGVPDTGSKVHCMIRAGRQQSEKMSTSLSSQDYWIITNIGASVLKKTAGFADFELEIRLQGKVFRERFTIPASSGSGPSDHEFKPYLVVPKNSDVRIRAIADANNTECSAHLDGVLAIVV